jgi:hypothetical protein
LFAFKRLRSGQPHEGAASGAWHKLIGADGGNAYGFHFVAGGHGQMLPIGAESGGLQSRTYTCPTKFDADVIFDTKFRFQSAANRKEPKSTAQKAKIRAR